MKRGPITPVSLSEWYVFPGEYSAKFKVDPRRSQELEIEDVLVVDADGASLPSSFRRWGTKLHVGFSLAGTTPDGVCLIDFVCLDGSRERFKFWFIKP